MDVFTPNSGTVDIAWRNGMHDADFPCKVEDRPKGSGPVKLVAVQLCLWGGEDANQNEVALLNHMRVFGKATHVIWW